MKTKKKVKKITFVKILNSVLLPVSNPFSGYFFKFFSELLALEKKLPHSTESGWDGVNFVHGILYGDVL